jgi:hypothetical protein
MQKTKDQLNIDNAVSERVKRITGFRLPLAFQPAAAAIARAWDNAEEVSFEEFLTRAETACTFSIKFDSPFQHCEAGWMGIEDANGRWSADIVNRTIRNCENNHAVCLYLSHKLTEHLSMLRRRYILMQRHSSPA